MLRARKQQKFDLSIATINVSEFLTFIKAPLGDGHPIQVCHRTDSVNATARLE
jgi:hypothetical protein